MYVRIYIYIYVYIYIYTYIYYNYISTDMHILVKKHKTYPTYCMVKCGFHVLALEWLKATGSKKGFFMIPKQIGKGR